MNHVRSIDAGGIRQCFCIRLFLDGCCQESCFMKQNHSQSRTPASEKAVCSDWIIYFTLQINFYSSSFLMLSLVEETRLSNLGSQSHLNQLSQYWYERFVYYKLTLYFLKGMVLIVLDQRVSYCDSSIDCWDLMLYDSSVHLYPMEPFTSCQLEIHPRKLNDCLSIIV